MIGSVIQAKGVFLIKRACFEDLVLRRGFLTKRTWCKVLIYGGNLILREEKWLGGGYIDENLGLLTERGFSIRGEEVSRGTSRCVNQ